ncbi:MAG TPA: hypothetical protein CFH83_08885 [Sulfuricurvum kujiense]|uniref:Lcl C-terminal domain-containing protein n=1 Tax=Sulfuricurvum kujiense TaxID=148813 RepID=A0A2D3W987_9BACT|nr:MULTISPECIES: DUF1566 domain-containing protein [Sulfuricurvum]DAB37892.1 MAG TPA: hypothetical protein CFH83_08885 [Sulfuricurvum kujiense]
MKRLKSFAADCWPIIVLRFSLILSLCVSIGWGEIRLSPSEHYTQEQAQEYCRSFGSSWRQMSIHELFALPSNIPFVEGFSYWSYNRGPSDNTEIGTGSEGDGGIIAMVGYSFFPKERNITLSPPTKKIAAACTDIPEIKPSRNYRLRVEGTEDNSSGLLWHSLDATDKRAKFTFDQAHEKCESLTLHGRAWRVPRLEELYGIVDYEHFRPSVDMRYFGAMMHRYYWSSESLSSAEGYVVGFKLGSVATVNKGETAYLRCVSE